MNKFPEITDISIEYIYEWQERGLSSKVIPEDIANYLDAMDKVRGMSLRFDKWGSKEAIVDYLVKVEGYSRYLADKLYNQTMEFFYVDMGISKEALFGRLYSYMEKNLHFAILKSQNTTDAEKVQRMIEKMKDLINDMFPEDLGFDDEHFRRPIKIYTMTPEEAGLPSANRKEINAMIEKFPELPELVKKKIKEEAMVLPMKIFMEENEDPRDQ